MAETPPGGINRRKRLFVNKRVQGRMIGMIAIFVTLAIFIFFIAQIVFMPQAEGPGSKRIVVLFVHLLLILILALIGVVYVGLRFSQKIAGPIYAFGRNLSFVYRGDYTKSLALRKTDEFQNLANAFNKTLEALRGRVQDDIRFLDKLAQEIGRLPDDCSTSKINMLNSINELKEAKAQLIAEEQKS